MKSALLGDDAEQALLQGRLAAQFGPDQYVPSSIGTIAAYLMMVCWVLMLLVTVAGLARTPRPPAAAGPRAAAPVRRPAGGMGVPRDRPPAMGGVRPAQDRRGPVADVTLALRTSLVIFTGLFVALGVVNCWLLARLRPPGPRRFPALGATPLRTRRLDPHLTFYGHDHGDRRGRRAGVLRPRLPHPRRGRHRHRHECCPTWAAPTTSAAWS